MLWVLDMDMAMVVLVLEPAMVLELVQTLQQQLVVDMALEELLEVGDMVLEEELLEVGDMVLEEELLEVGVMVLEEELLDLVAMAQGREARQELELVLVSSGKRRA
jgi:hypothetical protein